MAFKKTKELDNTGVTGDYWKIVQNNQSYIINDGVVMLQLYQSQESREQGKNPIAESVQFNFTQNDHPLNELDPELVDVDQLVADYSDTWVSSLETHIRYLHIKAVANIAQAKIDNDPGCVLSENEAKAVFFVDALNV